MKVFVVSYLSDPCDDMSWLDILGVKSTFEDARGVMVNSFKDALASHDIDESVLETFELEDGVDITFLDNYCKLYHFGSVYEWTIKSFDIN